MGGLYIVKFFEFDALPLASTTFNITVLEFETPETNSVVWFDTAILHVRDVVDRASSVHSVSAITTPILSERMH